jgi:predicted phosphodiesterase
VRVAALYDVHGNLPALEAVLAEVDREGVDAIVSGGDVVAGGPFPLETFELLRSLGDRVIWVRGNGDREWTPLAAEGIWGERTVWAAAHLHHDERQFLHDLPDTATLDVDGLGPVLFCHATPRSDEEIVTEASPESRWRDALAGVAESVVVCGHVHVQADLEVAGKRVVNAGSVGMPYEGRPGAYWALLGPDVDLRRTEYDLQAAAERILATGLPAAEEHVEENVLASPLRADAIAYFEELAAEATGP